METRTIPAEQWVDFSDRFTRDHLQQLVTIEVLAGENGPQLIADNLPLQGISFDTKGSRPSTISISAGDQPGKHINHTIDMPLYIRQANQANGDIDLQIEPARGSVTLIHVHGVVNH